MVSDRVLHAGILTEVRRNGHIAAIRILLLCLLGVFTRPVPDGACPGIAGEGALHTKHVVSVLRQLAFAVAGFQNELCQRHGCQNAGFLLVCRKQSADLLNHFCFRETGKDSGLRSLSSSASSRIRTTSKLCRDLLSQITHSGVHPVARTRLVGKPPMDRQHHLIRLGRVVQRLLLVPKPQQLLLAVSLTDIHAQHNQLLIHHIPEGIGL